MSRGSFWSVARAVAWRSAHSFFTNPAMLVPSLLFPMFFFTAFAGGLDLIGLYTLALLVNAAAMLFGCGVAMRLRTMQAGPAMQVPVFLILFLAPVWVPYELLTGWVKAAASVNPVTLVIEAERGFIAGAPVKVAAALLVAAALGAVAVLWARGGLRSAERAA